MEHTTIDVDKEGLVCLAFGGNCGFFLDGGKWGSIFHNRNKVPQCFTWNFKSHAKIQLPPIPDSEYLPENLLKCVVTCSTTHHRLHTKSNQKKRDRNDYLCTVFVFLKKELYFLVCRPPLYSQWEIIKFDKSWTRGLCDAVAFLDGKCIYTLSTDGKLGIIEDLPQRSIHAPFLSRAPTDTIAMYKRRQLVSYKNQLLLVQQKLGSPSIMEVWNVDLITGQFERMLNLDGIYIFLSRGYSSATYAPIQGNCVYFTEDDNRHCNSKKDELYAFDFKDQSIFLSAQENIAVHIPYNSVPSLMAVIHKSEQNAGDNLKDESHEGTHANRQNDNQQIVQPNNICDQLSLDLQRKISRYLHSQNMHSYMNFRSVCKLWRAVAPRLHWKVDMNVRSSGTIQDCIWLLTINHEDGLCTLYNPFTNLTCYMDNSDLVGCEIRYSRDGVLLVSRGTKSLFFVEPFSKRTMKLPARNEDYYCDTMSFSTSPYDSSDWMIFGIVSVNKYRVRITYLRAGDDSWTSLIMESEVPFLLSCSSPVYFGREFCVIGQDGNVGVFGFFQDGYCYWQIKDIAQVYRPRLASAACRHFLVQGEQNLLYSVIVDGQTREHVRVYELNFRQNTAKLVKEFKTWLIFISEASSFFMYSTKLAGLDSAVLLPKFNSNGDYIHYSLQDDTFKTGKDESDDIYCRKELLGRVWIHNRYLVPHVLYEK